ncbi:sensor histidine kinase [Nocardioides jishulii]|uniref:Signal transduction histidine kinase subgroup 3 dimerisation and phosphoacceptor domain-containing protein n=1 Tax=Nocardioides jishulii TaxID=2575440 RepID=A0A4U2YWC2_9ACTN|nr:histidine kinase [Nocardioides jishulii]QCX28646.1 hypothetical protein FCL41_14725 [Nocardioides jishulii]TKI64461.1 hypothetical protein FC770_04850 [Nocardioides jishulii]
MTDLRTVVRRPVRSSALARGWAGRSNVQRIDLYTRGSLRLLVWFLIGAGGLSALPEVGGIAEVVAVVVLVLAAAVVVDQCLAAFIRLWFEPGHLPRLWLAALALLVVPGVVWMVVGLSPDQRFGVGFVLTSAVAWALGGSRNPWVQAAPVVFGAAICGLSGPWAALYGAVIAAFFVFTAQSSLWVLGVVHELDRARTAQADLAVAEERLRFSRDVHDVMGRHLSTIAVQAELAATLAERGDLRAADRIREVRATAHEALREARALARGYRPVDLAQELEGARALLASAGIKAETDVAGLPTHWEEPVARLVREGVTNTLRHSRATRVTIGHADGVVALVNDGVANDGVASDGVVSRGRVDDGAEDDGSGLRTLAADVAGRGGRLSWGAEDDDFVVRLHLIDPEGGTP